MSFLQRIKQYIKWRITVIFLYFLCMLIFPAIDYLYGNNMDASIYAAYLITFLFLVFSVSDYITFYKRHTSLIKSKEHMSVEAIEMPPAFGLVEEDYQDMIGQLFSRVQDALQLVKVKNDGRMDYFTLWVHQIKTPISALHLLLQNAKEAGQDTAAMEMELFRIEQYVDMVLQYLRVDNLSNDLELAECDLNPLVKRLVRKYAAIFIHRKVTLILDELPGNVLSDEKWLSMVIEQGLSNALKYSPGGTVHIFMERQIPALVIEDTGIGIRKEDIKRIFERGFTGFNGRIKEKSTGLGLFLAKEAADKLGHRLEVESEVGAGTRFRIVFSKGRLEDF